jgi:hypothetical protein
VAVGGRSRVAVTIPTNNIFDLHPLKIRKCGKGACLLLKFIPFLWEMSVMLHTSRLLSQKEKGKVLV